MKKTITLLLAGALALSLTACGGNAAGGAASAPAGANSAAAGSSVTDGASPPNGDAATGETTLLVGEISAIAGNEIEVKLIKLPDLPDMPDSAVVNEDGSMDAVAMVPATPAGEASTGGAAVRQEVEYTGETKSFIIPAGLPIQGASGNDLQLSDLKKGVVLSLTTSADGTITTVFAYA